MRPNKRNVELARSSVRIARRRLRQYHDGDQAFMFDTDELVVRVDALLRTALEQLQDPDVEPGL